MNGIQTKANGPEKVLVTGASGFLGRALSRCLRREGYSVRALVRRSSDVHSLVSLGAEIAYGDMTDLVSFARAMDGMDVVVHAAASNERKGAHSESATLIGARNLAQLLTWSDVRKVVYISSCSVYGITGAQAGTVLMEEAALEQRPWLRGRYTQSKADAEAIMRSAMNSGEIPIVILRPGTIYGPEGELFPPIVGACIAGRVHLVIGGGGTVVPLVYIDNVADAIVRAIRCDDANNEVFNVVDDERVTKRQYVEQIVKPLGSNAAVLYLPYWIVRSVVIAQEKILPLLGRDPWLTSYRFTASQTAVHYSSRKIQVMLNWHPLVSFSEAARRIVEFRRGGRGLGRQPLSGE